MTAGLGDCGAWVARILVQSALHSTGFSALSLVLYSVYVFSTWNCDSCQRVSGYLELRWES